MTKKRVRAQTGGQTTKEAKKETGELVYSTSQGEPAPAAARGLIDPAAIPISDIFEFDPETLEFPAAGFVKDPQSKQNVDLKAFLKRYPGLVLPTDPGFVKGTVKFQRDPKTGKLSLIPRETKAKGGKVGTVMHEFKAGTLHSGSKRGPKVTSRDQAIAIAMSEARKAGEDVPRRQRFAAGGQAFYYQPPGQASPISKATPWTAQEKANLAKHGNIYGAQTGQRATSTSSASSSKNLVGTQAKRVEDIRADTSGITNLTKDLRNFQPGGGQDIASLRNFQPLTGLGAQTQNELLSTGFQTDVAPLTEAAKIRAGQEFDTATSGINERLASLGLISSSAQTAAEARERAKMGERIGATGLEAGVQAAEAAAGRRASGIGNELSAGGLRLGATQGALQGALGQSGQRLQGLGTALGGETSAAGLNLEAAQGRAGAGQSLINSQMPQFGAEMAQAPAGGSTTSGGTSGGSGIAAGGVGSNFSIPRYGAASGGRADLGDFLSKLLYGRTFTRRSAEPSQPTVREPRRSTASSAVGGSSLESLQKAILEEQLRKMRQPVAAPRGEQEIGPEELGRAAASTLDPSNRLGRVGTDFQKLGTYMKFLGPQEVGANVRTAGQGFAQMGSSAAGAAAGESAAKFGALTDALARNPSLASTFTPMLRQRAAGGGVPQPPLPQEHAIQTPALFEQRRRFYDTGGGVAPGEDTGHDKIPALLRSEELVLTPEIAGMVMEANPLEPNPELIMAMQDLAQQPLEFNDGEGEFMAQQGGSAPSFLDRLLRGNPEATARTFESRFGFQPEGEPVGREDVVNAIGAIVGALPDAEKQRQLQGLLEDLPIEQYPAPSREDMGFAPSDPFEFPAGVGGAPELSAEGLDLGGGSVSLTGPSRLAQAGNAGMGTITPRAGGKGSFSAMTTTVPSAQPLTPEQLTQQRLDDAIRHRDRIRSVLNTDIVGSPEKQARFLTALDNADKQVSAVTDEILAREQQRLLREETSVRRTMAQANLNESVANTLRSKAQQQTAEAALARQMLEAAASDPVVAQILNGLEKLGGIKDERTAAMYEAVFGKILESRGVQLREHGWLKRFLGAPEFEVAPMQPEAGAPTASPTDDVSAMLQASRTPITPEMLTYFNQFAGAP